MINVSMTEKDLEVAKACVQQALLKVRQRLIEGKQKGSEEAQELEHSLKRLQIALNNAVEVE